ncbi:O-antigen ligase family protein [Candidatus Parcubacteria bacterium]|nr:O-antigen ligase family protein [Candidatus Parcubacteria bacterium]
MSNNIKKINKNRDILLRRALWVIVPFLLAILALDKVSLITIFGILAVYLIFVFAKDKIWYLLVLAVPSLVFGKILYIPITNTWVYEARFAEVFLGMVLIVFISDVFLNNKIINLKFDKISFGLLIFLIASLASIYSALDFRLFVFALKTIVFSFLAYFLALNLLDNKKKVFYFLYSMAITGMILSAQIFWKFYQMGFSIDFFFNRSDILIPIGPIATTAAILTFLAPILLAFYFQLNDLNKWKPFVFLGFFMSFFAVFLTLGKGAIISLFFGLFVVFCMHKQKRIAYILFFMWFAALLYFGFQPYFAGLFERFKTTLVDVNTEFRVKEYKLSFDLIKNHPWMGVGVGQQLYYYKKILNQEQGNFVNNFILQTVIDLGLAGLFLMLFIIKNIIKKIKDVWRAGGKESVLVIGFIAAFAAAFLNGMVEVTIYALPYAIVFWLTLGVFENAAEREEKP